MLYKNNLILNQFLLKKVKIVKNFIKKTKKLLNLYYIIYIILLVMK
jgi:hypothetical protein